MSQYIIEGGQKLKGRIRVSGNKNSILPCLAACLLTEEEVILHNVPHILDVDVCLKILQDLGALVEWDNHMVKVVCKDIPAKASLPQDLSNKLRASILFVGGLLSRVKELEFYHPGGDVLGRRGIELHLEGFKKIGFQVRSGDLKYKIYKKDMHSDAHIFLEIATVTGTENLILASVKREGTAYIRNAAQEPHVMDLCNLLNQMGAKISGVGTSNLKIEGVNKLHGTEFTIGPDYMEFATYSIAAAITGGTIEIENCQHMDLDPVIWPLIKMGVIFEKDRDLIRVYCKKINPIPRLITNVWPGFPTDVMSVVIVLATQARGVSLLHDWIYESRMFFVDKLIAMGANITIADPHRVVVYGPTKLKARHLESPDIRAGMALVLAALIAKGTSTLNRAELIERGYEDVVGKLTALGAYLQRVD